MRVVSRFCATIWLIVPVRVHPEFIWRSRGGSISGLPTAINSGFSDGLRRGVFLDKLPPAARRWDAGE